jgi:hypothetical protein
LACARSVTALDAAESEKNGSFSATRAILALAEAPLQRWSGQQSRSNRTHGSVTSIGLHIRPRAKRSTASP